MLLSKDQILKQTDLGHEDFQVPEWGGTVRIKTLSGLEKEDLESKLREKLHNIRANWLAATLIDESGKNLFSESDIESLGKTSCAVMDKVFERALERNGVKKDKLEEIEKN
jgi:hypothetical protein